jgi:hypothetical protein
MPCVAFLIDDAHIKKNVEKIKFKTVADEERLFEKGLFFQQHQ